ncbi:hypothetical protein [Naasia lichenicola]|uniref:Uncharacterized protein n=1 Tax=Naasia lichenicola TaxID=2565933 RepID=A0A4S4FET4_9MICO|nr:hypothetical protein [Naasia lichenicola]THG28621.1 hypothetical protein E6C64_17640 [Naasia lichenicola]
MSDAQSPSNIRYLAEFVDGPLAGRSETRVMVDDTYDTQLSSISLVDGIEAIFWYNAGETREIEGELHVSYTFDARDSDPTQSGDADESLRL